MSQSDTHDTGCKALYRLPPGTFGAAKFAGERNEHRLTLHRWWEYGDSAPFALWSGMNPSGAEADVNDLTILKECKWSRRIGGQRYIKTNTGTYRWTDSTTLDAIGTPLVHPDNLETIRALAAEAAVFVLSTGTPPDSLLGATRTLFAALKRDGRKPLCLGVTKAGWPKHSSRLGYATPFVPYSL